MSNKGVIPFKFDDTQFDLKFIQIGDFVWYADRRKCTSVTTESDRCDQIGCEPKPFSPTILWNCVAMGTLAAVSEKKQFPYLVWNGSCGNNSVVFCVNHEKKKVSKALAAIGNPKPGDADGGIYVEIVNSFITDLSDPHNTLIQGPEDAAKCKINDEYFLWLSKKVLAANSPYFAGLFKKNFKEGTDGCYDLKGLGHLKLDVFIQFYGIVHGLEMPMTGGWVDRLLHLADFFQCKVVLRRCEDFLRNAPEYRLSLREKLRLAVRFKLDALLVETANKMPLEELKKLHFPSGTPPLVAEVMAQKMRLIDA
ncbi:hypothetical protein L596_013194 [Steinernema carpocapsae]|uniref:BTB domain-containing protein n=1 Tax=Steinernema carpocapsae TaxID=34508 RepID=A0A4U5P091_STECR|nr:hypothetical protein L596_013194 [Steinernema carpocapsae]